MVAFWIFIFNRKGPNWIKGFISSLFVSYVFLAITATIRLVLIVRKPEDSWVKTLLETLGFFMDYISWQIYFVTMILFTLFYWVNAKYNEHVIKFGTTNTESTHQQRVAFTKRYSKITMVLSIIVFLCITLFFILAATVPQDVFGEEKHFFNWKTNAEWFEETYNVNIFVYFSWKFFENLTKIVIAIIYFKSLLIIAKLPAKTKKTNLLFLHALFMFTTILADMTCTIFVIVTAYKERGSFYKGIVISFTIWRICDTIYILFMLTIAS